MPEFLGSARSPCTEAYSRVLAYRQQGPEEKEVK